MKRFLLTTAAALTLAGTAALATIPVGEIDVQTDLTAIENEKAASVWSGLDADLETALAERLAPQIEERGAKIEIDIDEVELANSFEQSIGTADSVLSGEVKIKVPGLANNERYTLTVTTDQAQQYFPDGTVMADLTLGSDIYYEAIIAAFADNVVKKLQ
ncbi:hypothetical protein [Tateyamaria sp. ANG-S1]|uniref:hypothetical protein n=1 Tax=Tateyamaria sp. ANG-S1 TaxID=1577905 RepID=UPI00057D8D0E|nr:hypothetical protein [Tateyamaria sp. ANG-S1]KIC48597.1 hypothetical protein RA29_12800 [Tateyamaria sp. ANG-S1]